MQPGQTGGVRHDQANGALVVCVAALPHAGWGRNEGLSGEGPEARVGNGFSVPTRLSRRAGNPADSKAGRATDPDRNRKERRKCLRMS